MPEKKIQWNPSKYCNYDCEYCYNTQAEKYYPLHFSHVVDVELLKNKIDSLAPSLFVIGGGEPFCQYRIVDIFECIVKKHALVIVTNLSQDITEFCSRINPKNVRGIAVSLHYHERLRRAGIDSFISRHQQLVTAGFPTLVSQVLYPDMLQVFEEVHDYFKRFGIVVHPKIFEGTYRGQTYPYSYTDDQKKTIIEWAKIAGEDESEILKTQSILFMDQSFKGRVCAAGLDTVVITEDGSVHRCWTIKSGDTLGNFYKGSIEWHSKPMTCTYDRCACPQMGFEYS